MTGEKATIQKSAPAKAREDRLKAALKQNMARRKAQAKARTQAAPLDTTDEQAQPSDTSDK